MAPYIYLPYLQNENDTSKVLCYWDPKLMNSCDAYFLGGKAFPAGMSIPGSTVGKFPVGGIP